MRQVLQGVTAVVVLLPAGLCAAEYTFTGTAMVDGTPTYTESHTLRGECGERFRPRQHEVVYRSTTEDTVIGTKSLAYEESPLRPSFDFRQPPFDERMQLTNRGDTDARIDWQTPAGETETFEVGINDDVVIDAGFVHFIQANWQSLNSGRNVDFRFMGPTRGEHYAFVAEPTDSDAIDAHLTVRIRPSGMILRWLVDPITLGFDQQGRLTDYLGLTNIRQSDDNNYVAHIRYGTSRPPCPLI
ncbi:hypothetical protein CF392_15610 [Tamilnaduibacter salinus]|nr:hypothetical protein CF392_15610 [Tamilnaduibacter salinus]